MGKILPKLRRRQPIIPPECLGKGKRIRKPAGSRDLLDALAGIEKQLFGIIQPVLQEFGGSVSFHGTIGTQTTMPFGTPDEVRAKVFEHMEIAKTLGGLLPAPTHLLEPEVPWENILAYAEACRDYRP